MSGLMLTQFDRMVARNTYAGNVSEHVYPPTSTTTTTTTTALVAAPLQTMC